MLYRHMKTGEKREFVQGMKIADAWKPVHQFKSGRGTVEISEISPKSITSHKLEKAAKTRAKNKAKAVEAEVVDQPKSNRKKGDK